MPDYKDYPIEKCQERIDKIFEKRPDARFYQKFTCENCGNRLTIEEPNVFYTQGRCDNCDHVTDLRKRGCNYMMVLGLRIKL